jgi:hypothetical protein
MIAVSKEFRVHEKTRYLRQMQARLDDVSHKIDELESRLDVTDGRRTTLLYEMMRDLRVKQVAAKSRLEEFDHYSFPGWVELKGGLEMAMIILEQSYHKVLSHLSGTRDSNDFH